MNITHTDNLWNVCRVCLEKSMKIYPLEGPILNVDVYVSTMINYCTSCEVNLDEDLPKGVCLPCFKTIRIAYNFIKQFKENNEKLLAQRKLKENNSLEHFQEECNDTEDPLAVKAELVVEESNESLVNDIVEHSPERNCFSPEEKIIITYVSDHNSSDEETTPELPPKNAKNISKVGEITNKIQSQSLFFNRHVCPVCFNIFTDFKRGLLKHLHRDHENKVFKCNKCSIGVDLTVELYIQHYTKSHLFQCPVCNKKLRSKSSFYYHSKNHTEDSAFKCPKEACQKAFQNQISLRKHMQTHSDDAKYICSKCGKKFNTYDTFRYHNKTHDGKRSHLCNVCGRSFLQSVHLKYHMWHHTGIKQFHCDDCGKSYTSVTQLKKHRRKYCGAEKAEYILK